MTQIPETVDAADVTSLVRRGRRRGDRLRHLRRVRRGQRRGRGRAGSGAGEGCRSGRHQRDGRWPLLSRRRHRGAAGDGPRRQSRRDVQVPGRGLPGARPREDPRVLRRQRRALQLVGGLGFSVRAQLLPGQDRRSARHRGAVLHRQREGVAVLRAGEARAARPLGAGARRTRRRRHGHRSARQARRRARRRGPLRDRGDEPRRRRRCGRSVCAGSTSPKPVRSRPSRSSSPPAGSR